jgi:hypothetical protein
MNEGFVVVEGVTDKRLIEEKWKSKPRNVKIVEAGGRSSAISLARSILITRNVPIALVVDADTDNERKIEEQEQFIYEITKTSPLDSMLRVFMPKPTLEQESPERIKQLIEQINQFMQTKYVNKAASGV